MAMEWTYEAIKLRNPETYIVFLTANDIPGWKLAF